MDTKIRVHRAPKTLITGNGCVAQIGVEAKTLNRLKNYRDAQALRDVES